MTGRVRGTAGSRRRGLRSDVHGQSRRPLRDHGWSGRPWCSIVVIVLGIFLLPSATRGPPSCQRRRQPVHHTHSVPPTTTTTHPTTTTTLPDGRARLDQGSRSERHDDCSRGERGEDVAREHGFDTSAFPPYNTTTLESADAVYVVGNGTGTMADEVAAALALGTLGHQAAVGTRPPVSTTTGADVVVVFGTDLAYRADAGTLGQPPRPPRPLRRATTS